MAQARPEMCADSRLVRSAPALVVNAGRRCRAHPSSTSSSNWVTYALAREASGWA
jgi:hypothetical protein